MPNHTANLSRSGFDMSQSFAFTASTGMILPVYSDFLNGGEKVSFSTHFFGRTQPLVTAAMADVDFYFDWFFVPMSMIFSPWGQWRMQTRDFVSSLVSGALKSTTDLSNFPLLNVGTALNAGADATALSVGSVQFMNGTVPVLFDPNRFDSVGKSLFRMADMLGFNPFGVLAGTSQQNYNTINPNTFVMKASAYQCIYQNWFRNDDFEPFNLGAYNIDYWLNSSSPYVISANSPENPFVLRYSDYRRDYYQSVKPSPISSAVNMLSSSFGGSSSSVNILASVDNYLSNGVSYAADSSGDDSVSVVGTNNSFTQFIASGGADIPSNRIASGQLRSLFAVEKLLRVTGRAAKTYDAQFLAHYGWKIPHDVKHELTHLHSAHAMLHIGEVVGTADTFTGSTGSALGEIAGKGYVQLSEKKREKFTAPCDGIIMCTFRAIPRLRVRNVFDRQNAVTSRTDFYIPEFDKLGMQPLYSYEVNPDMMNTSSRVGWQTRYQQWKQKPDRVSAVMGNLYIEEGAISDQVNQYSAWVLSYSPFVITSGSQNVSSVTFVEAMKCPPTALNNIMVTPYTPTVTQAFITNPSQEFYTDPFICDFRADVKKVSTMSPSGEPDMPSF